jgi:hypothetical protein
VIPLFDVEVGDASERGGTDVDIGLRLDLTSAIHNGGQVLVVGFAGGDLGDAGLAVNDASDDDSSQNQDDYDDCNNLFSAHCYFLGPSRTAEGALGGVLSSVVCHRDNTEPMGFAFPNLVRNRGLGCFHGN